MKHPRNTCALLSLAIATLPAASTRADVGMFSSTPAAQQTAFSQGSALRSQASHRKAAQAPVRTTTQKAAAPVGLPHLAAVPKPTVKTPVAKPMTLLRQGQPIRVASGTVTLLPALPAAHRNAPMRLAAVPMLPLVANSAPVETSKTLRAGESEVLDFDQMTTTAVGDPTVADIVPLSSHRLLINGKAPGHTTLFVFDRHGKNIIHIVVTPSTNIDPLAERIQQEINNPTVTVHAISDTVFLEGTVGTQAEQLRAEAIASAYAPKVKNLIQVIGAPIINKSEADIYAALLTDNLAGSGIIVKVIDDHTIALTGKYASPIAAPRPVDPAVLDTNSTSATAAAQKDPLDRLIASLPGDLKVVNLINFEVQAARQILVHAKIIDINRSAAKNFGINWGTLNETVSGQNTTFTFSPQPVIVGQTSGPTSSLLGGGPLKRFLPIGAQINALVSDNKARVLSEPSLLVLEGNEGSILVGGQIPIPVAQAGGTTNTITVQYEPFGIRLNVTPVVVNDSTIQMTVTPEVSELDFGNGVSLNGNVIPALSIRRETSTLQLQDGQTLIIGGLYSTNMSRNVSAIPILSKIPILGEFFKDSKINKNESELIVLIQADIVKPGTPGIQAPPPGSLENMSIEKPFVSRHEFDQDFPDLDKYFNGNKDQKEKPKAPVALPATPSTTGNGK